MRTFVPLYSILSISTLCCSPMESCHIFASGSTLSPYFSERLRIFSMILFLFRLRGSSLSPRTMFSQTVNTGTSIKCWWTMPIPFSIARRGLERMTGFPSISIVPASGRYIPARQFIRVVLPAPFSPRILWTSPLNSSKSTSLFAYEP
ncbi:hypothetical protein SDC9_183161 [bioreactor metagenome]|uniref:Uncharacterized protein n=1 Tax=bioreactor metagenome TaxID=1076179 RepID=A0A645HJ39_9ZZZZ